ncbi:MAG TPA: PAS domain S-box protein, partial [Roseiflexaceae bacterium]|nr:PAS domain S-box protein [Roseiflexaceae bacterium]
ESAPRWLAAVILAIAPFVILLDWVTGPAASFSILFVLPVLLAAWFGWRNLAYLLALLLPLTRVWFEVELWRSDTLPIAILNGAIRLGVLLLLVLFGDMAGRYVRRLQLRFAAIVDAAEEAIIGLGLDGAIRSWNPGAERLFGYRAGEIVGRPVTLLAAPGQVDEVQASLARLARGERIPPYETVRRCKDGSLVDVSVISFPIQDDHGATVGATKIIHDITKRKRAEEAVTEALGLYKMLVEANHDGVIYNDIDGNIISVNTRFAELFGFGSTEEVLASGLTTFDLLAPEEQATAMDKAAPVFETDILRHIEMKVRRRDGTYFDAEFNTTIVRDEQGKLQSLVTFVRDVSERKHAEVELLSAEIRYRTLIEQIPAVTYVVEFGDRNRTTFVSPQIEALLGYTPEEWLADPSLWFGRIHPDDEEAMRTNFRQNATDPRALNAEYRMLTRDGHVVWIHNTASRILD